MEKIEQVLKNLDLADIIKLIFHSPNKSAKYKKIIGRPIIVKKEIVMQFEQFTDKQVFHMNITQNEFSAMVMDFVVHFKKLTLQTKQVDYDFLIGDKAIKVIKNQRKNIIVEQNLCHNKAKNYLIPENTLVAPLIDLGVFTAEGKVVKAMYDKYKQINRFLELVNDATKKMACGKIHIVDFGCGKSYLTFILYYFLKEVCKYDISIIGLDLKQDVIDKCNGLAQKYNYEDLHFITGDIKDYLPKGEIDLVITLHACDTATDYALYNAVKWNAKAILSVPCCQHEVNAQIKTKNYSLLTKHGIIKERISALITDTIRANLLEINDYEVQILEFVDFSHSPKNLLIRAIKKINSSNAKNDAKREIDCILKEYNIYPTLCKLMSYEKP